MRDKAKQSAYIKEWRARRLAEDPDYESRKHAKWRAENPDRLKEYRLRRLGRDPDYERRYNREWRTRDESRAKARERAQVRNRTCRADFKEYLKGPAQREKEVARQALRRAVRKGQVAKPDECGDCGKVFPKARIHAHHADYSEPLRVEWLCAACHGKRHLKQ